MHAALNVVGGTLRRIPGSFGIARMFGRSYSLRCVVFHNISTAESPFTTGISVSITPGKFEAALKFLTSHYTPVSLQDVLTDLDGRGLPARPVLVTFDDAYASVAELAAPLCRRYGVPAVFFVNAAFLNNQRLAADNLVCYVTNVRGMDAIKAAARTLRRTEIPQFHSRPRSSPVFSPLLRFWKGKHFSKRCAMWPA